jgi:hypothetical protein
MMTLAGEIGFFASRIVRPRCRGMRMPFRHPPGRPGSLILPVQDSDICHW